MNSPAFYVDETAQLGVPLRMLQGCVWSKSRSDRRSLVLPNKLYVGPFAVVGEDVLLGEEVVVDAFCTIDPRTTIGPRSLLIYRASVGGDCIIGEDCIIGGFISENCVIGSRCRVLGSLIHSHRDPTMSWDHHDTPEPPPELRDDVFVGFGALVIGGVKLHEKAYVCAGARVTRDVPARHVAYGINQIVPCTEWKGSLSHSDFFRGTPESL